jgi:hypothetical protein
MGLTYSTPQTDRAKVNKIENVTKLAELNLNESDDLLDSLNITELNRFNKEPLPIIGGQYSDVNRDDDDDDDNDNLSRNTRFIPSKSRFNNYDLFKVINELENKNKLNRNLKGGNLDDDDDNDNDNYNLSRNTRFNRNLKGGNLEEDLSKSISDDDAMEQVQNIILQELDKVSNKNMTGGGDCGCNGSKNNLEGGKRKTINKNQKKSKKTLTGGDSSSEKIKLDSSDDESSLSSSVSSSLSSSLSSSSIKNSSNGDSDENNENGLSIFPMNSSDVNNSSSERNFRMLRRRV